MKILVINKEQQIFSAESFALTSSEKINAWDANGDTWHVYNSYNASEFFEVLKGFIVDEINAGKQNVVVDVEYLASLM